jgi:Peptidase of plants and bacteria
MRRRSSAFLLAILLLSGSVALRAAPAAPARPPVAAIVQTTLASAPRQIRQFAFDADPDSYFASKDNAGAADHFTLVFDKPVALKAVAVTTGKPNGGDALDAGKLEVSADGKTFEPLVPFTDGVARAKPDERKVHAIRIQPGKDLDHSLAIREFTIESEPPVAVFKYPVEIVVDVSDAPEMKEWAEKAAHVCERQYPMICEELRSDGFKPRNMITMRLRNDYQGVAAAGGGRITGSVKFFQAHPDDIGAMVHETVHCVQQYRTGNNPGWLVEGIADYIRFFKYEPGKLRPLNPERARYNGSYKVTAAFLAYVTDKYDPELVRKLNKVMREGEYKEEVWKTLTKKTLQELDEEWRASMRP